MTANQRNYNRRVYGLSNLLGQIGGLMSSLVFIFRLFYMPIAKHLYYLIAIKRLFMARTVSDDIFKAEKKGESKSEREFKIVRYLDPSNFKLKNDLSCEMKREISKHRLIRISTLDNFLIFIHDHIGCCLNCKFWKNKDRLMKVFKEGRIRIEKDLNIIKLVRNLKRLNILMKSSMLTPDIKF